MKLSWGHGVVIALGTFMVFITSAIIFFPMGKQGAELVEENYYEAELHYQDVIDAKNRANKLEQRPDLKILPTGIMITFPEEINNDNSTFNFYLFRTNDKNLDVKKEFQLGAANTVNIPQNILVPGNYTLKLKWTKDNKDYQIDYDIQWK